MTGVTILKRMALVEKMYKVFPRYRGKTKKCNVCLINFRIRKNHRMKNESYLLSQIAYGIVIRKAQYCVWCFQEQQGINYHFLITTCILLQIINCKSLK